MLYISRPLSLSFMTLRVLCAYDLRERSDEQKLLNSFGLNFSTLYAYMHSCMTVCDTTHFVKQFRCSGADAGKQLRFERNVQNRSSKLK